MSFKTEDALMVWAWGQYKYEGNHQLGGRGGERMSFLDPDSSCPRAGFFLSPNLKVGSVVKSPEDFVFQKIKMSDYCLAEQKLFEAGS